MDAKTASELRKLGIDPEDFDESQRDLLKSMGIDLDGSEEGSDGDVSDEDVIKAVNTLRKAAGARGLTLAKALGTAEGEEEESVEEGAEAEATVPAKTGTVKKATDNLPLTENEVFTQIMKAENGDLVQLVDGDAVLGDVVKAFGGQQAQTNKALVLLEKRSTGNSQLQNRALTEIKKSVDLQGKAFEGLVEILKAVPAFKTQQGALGDLQTLTGAGAAAAAKPKAEGDKTEIEKAIGANATEEHDILSELSGSQLFGLVKKAFDDEDTRKEFGLKSQHWEQVSRRGVNSLPKKFLPKLREIVIESREQ